MAHAVPAVPVNMDDSDTYAEQAASVLRRAILTGELKPGAKLRIRDLHKSYGIGATPLREGMSRLVADGLIQFVGGKGFRVVQASEADLRDIILVRKLIELEAVRLAISRGDDEWEAGIIASLHRLVKASAPVNDHWEGAAGLDMVHKRFHTALIEACGSPRMLEMHSQLYDQAYRYRRVILTSPRRTIAIDEHKELAELAIARKVKAACKLLDRHLSHTLKMAYGVTD